MTIELANRLYELRKAHGLSQDELAEKLGVSRQAVSKWERSEASPDTDNIISLAKIYNLSLDELIYGAKEEDNKKDNKKDENNNSPESSSESSSESANGFVNIEDGGNTVKIGPGGILVEDEKGEKVHIALNGIQIKTSKSHIDEDDDFDDDEDDEDDDDTTLSCDDDHTITILGEDGHFKININKERKRKHSFWQNLPYPIICGTLYLIFGFCNVCGGWAQSWIIFVTIPVYYSLVNAIVNRRFCDFAYPVFSAAVYLYFGVYLGIWHPSWLIFVTIPLYYSIAGAIDKSIKRRRVIVKTDKQ